MTSYMHIDTLNHLTGEGAVVSAAAMYVDPSALPDLMRRLKDMPTIEAVAMKAHTLASFLDKVTSLVIFSAGILTAFAVIIAVGVVYNGARIALQERARELASLRVLGFTRTEVGRILFGQFTFEIFAGLVLGLFAARGLVSLIATYFSNESFQIPAVIAVRTYVAATLVILVAALASAYIVRGRIDRLDLVAVLKTRD